MNATEGATRSYTSAGDSSAIGVGVVTGVGDGVAVGVGVFVGVGDEVAVGVGVAVGTLVVVAPDELAASRVPSDRGSSVHPTAHIATVPIIKPTTMA